MALTILNTTTLSVALTDSLQTFTVGSTANIVAGNYIAILGTAGLELAKVQAVPTSGQVTVMRGIGGTRALPHPSGARVFIGAPDLFSTIAGSSPSEFVRLTGVPGDFPDYAIPGTRAIDGIGNEYVLCELTETLFSGVTVVISVPNYTAAVLTSGSHGPVGIAVEPGTSDQYIWVLRKGYYATAQDAAADSAATSAYFPTPATSVSSPAAGMATVVTSTAVLGATIQGMFIVGAAVSTTTSTTSVVGTTVPVYLNYPWVEAAVAGSS